MNTMNKIQLSYQRLFSILAPLAEEDARYVLFFLHTHDKEMEKRYDNIKKLKAELLRKIERANKALDQLKEHYLALEQARGKRGVKVYKELSALLEQVERSPELALDNTPRWQRLVSLVEKIHSWLDAEEAARELVMEETRTVA